MSGRNWMAMTGGIHSTLFTMYDLRRRNKQQNTRMRWHGSGFVEVGQGRVGVPVAPEDAHVPLAHVQHQRQHRPGVEHGAVREQEEEEDDEPVVRAEEHLVLHVPTPFGQVHRSSRFQSMRCANMYAKSCGSLTLAKRMWLGAAV